MKTACLLLLSTALVAADAVDVRVEDLSVAIQHAPNKGRGNNAEGWYYDKKARELRAETVRVVVLDNGLVEAWVCPELGGRLLRAVDRATGADYFARVEPFTDHLAWQTGGVKASFPFFEHGTHLRQATGHRVVRHADGAVSVAMDQRFTQHQSVHDRHRYGRYSDEILSLVVTLRPGSTLVEWHQRKDNPNPLPRAERCWNVVLFPQDKHEDRAAMKAATRFVYPARYVTDHGPTTVHSSPHWSCLDNWDVSHFAIDAPWGFAGGYYPETGINRLRINDPGRWAGPAAKLYTAFWPEFFELWGGQGHVFEQAGELLPAHRPVAFRHRFLMAAGIGEADYATDDIALGIEDGGLRLVATRAATAEVVADGATIAAGPVGPHTVLAAPFERGELVVRLDGEEVLRQSFPLARPTPSKDETIPDAVREFFEQLKAPSPYRFERETVAANEGMTASFHALRAAPEVDADHDPVAALSIARTCYRFGAFDQAARIAGLFPGPEADLVLGLIALERGEATDFGTAGVEADHLRALQARAAGDTAGAIAAVERYLAAVPDAWYPRLWRAFWQQDPAAAQALAAENPASPEAQLVLRLLGAANDYEQLLIGNDEAAVHCAIFRAQLEDGRFEHLPRFGNLP